MASETETPKKNVEISSKDMIAKESQGPSLKRAPKKIYIPIRIQTNAINKDDVAINATYISIEDLVPVKRKRTRDIEIRYLDSIRSLRDKIKSAYSCSQDHCPMIKERMTQHQREHHQNPPPKRCSRSGSDQEDWACHRCNHDRHMQTNLSTKNSSDLSFEGKSCRGNCTGARASKTAALSPAPSSILRKPHRCNLSESRSIQTPCKKVDFNHKSQNTYSLLKNHNETQYSDHRIPKCNEQNVTATSNCLLRDELKNEIQKWYEDIPIYPTLTSSLKNLRQNMITEFTDKIFYLSNNCPGRDYEENVKAEVDNFLNALPMWYPGAKRDQTLLKEGIKNNLLQKIKSLSHNTKQCVKRVNECGNSPISNSLTSCRNDYDQDNKENIIETEILDWLMQIKFKGSDNIGKTINIIDATDIFTKRLTPLLDRPAESKNYKLILKGLIFDTLNDLPNVLQYPKNKRYYLNSISEDLAKRLIRIQHKYKKCFSCCHQSNKRTFRLSGLNSCFQNVSIEQRNDNKRDMTDIFTDCLESVRFKEDVGKEELINNVLGNHSVFMSETQTSDVPMENIRDILADDIITADHASKDIATRNNVTHTGAMSIYSEYEFSGNPLTSTPKQRHPVSQEASRLNKEEMTYMLQVSLLIRNWMETLPLTFCGEEEQSFKEVMINNLAGDILDQHKLQQLAPITVADRDNIMFYIVFRWMFRFEIYDDLNDATPQIKDLVIRLREIPVPMLTIPQGENRQAMANIRHMEGASNILEDEISIWMNEQPPEIYSVKDKDYMNKMVHELALTVKNKINDKRQEKTLDSDLSKWLNIMLKSSQKDNIDNLKQNLKGKLVKLPIDVSANKQSHDMQTDGISSSCSSKNSCQRHANTTETESETLQRLRYNVDNVDSNRKAGSKHPFQQKYNNISDSELSQPKKLGDSFRKGKATPAKGTNEQTKSQLSKSKKGAENKNQGSKDGKTSKSKTSKDSVLKKSFSKKFECSTSDDKKSPSKKTDENKPTEYECTATDSNKKKQNKKSAKKQTSSDSEWSDISSKSGSKDKKKQLIKKATKSSSKLDEPPPGRVKSSIVTKSGPKRNSSTSNVDDDKTLTKLIGKYLEHSNDIDDNVAKGAFGEILKTEFRKRDRPIEQNEFNQSNEQSLDAVSPERLGKELQYIKDISDWLKNISIDGSFNTPQNKERIEFVNELANNIYEIEKARQNDPKATDYNSQLVSTITEFTERLPILPEQHENISLMAHELLSKIVAGRTTTSYGCCINKPDQNKTTSSLNSSGIPEQNLSEFIDNYIRYNAGALADDPVKLDAWSARVLKEAKKIAHVSAEPSACKAQVYDKLADISIPNEESIRLFGLELDYAKEISEWSNNLPLLPITTTEASDQRVKMISELAEKFVEKEKEKIVNPSESQNNEEIEEYTADWISRIPLDPNKDVVMPVVIHQLLNRIDRVNKGPQEPVNDLTKATKGGKSKEKEKNKSKAYKYCCKSGENAGQLVVEAIETWSNNLPVKGESKDEEKSIKENVARKLYQKVGDLTADPQVMHDDLLFEELLADEVDNQLQVLPCDKQKNKESLKNNIVDKVMGAKSLAEDSGAGENYKQQLETTIDASIPNPVSNYHTDDPGFEIYKKRMAEMFILENFDHGNDDVKLKYEKRIKNDINKYHRNAEMKNAFPLSKEEIYYELYGSLFKVPTPCKSSTADEVAEVKTRCEIAAWFENLPLQPASDGEEVLKRDNIQSMLAKRIREIEKNEKKPDGKIHKAITKWLMKLPLLPGNEGRVDELANDLENTLKATKEDRKHVPLPPLNKSSKSKGFLGTSQIAGPSCEGQVWPTPPPSSQAGCQRPITPRKKAADIILEIVDNWCKSLPFYENTPKIRYMNNIIREDLSTKIIIKICELNGNPETFADDILYSYLLDEELETLMADMPICCDFKPTKDYKKEQLKQTLITVKPLIEEERARYEYKKELNSTVDNILKEPLDTTEDKVILFNELREEIVDSFVQMNYNRDDDEGKQIYKARLKDAVLKYFMEIQENPDGSVVDPLMKQNQLICELAKIPLPNENYLQDEVHEIRMKNEVEQFFKEQALDDNPETNSVKLSLCKRLNEIEKTGHNCTNDAKMRKEINRSLKKLDIKVPAEEIQSFVDNLRATEAARKAPPVKLDDSNYDISNDMNQSQQCKYLNPNANMDASRPANIRASMNNSQRTSAMKNIPTPSNLCCPNDARSLGVTPVEYQGFDQGVPLSSSPQPANMTGPPGRGNIDPYYQPPGPSEQGEGPTGRSAASKRKKQTTSDRRQEDCICLDGGVRCKVRGRPRCVLRRPQYCDDCNEYGPMWMPMPPHRNPHGCYYY